MNLEFCTVLPFGLGIVALQWRIGAPLCCYFFSCPNLTLHSTLQLRSRRRRLRNLHTDPSLPHSFLRSLLSFSSVGTVFTILHASLPPSFPPVSAVRCKICKSRRKGAELYGAEPSVRSSAQAGGQTAIRSLFWRSKLEFILALRRFRALFLPPSLPAFRLPF